MIDKEPANLLKEVVEIHLIFDDFLMVLEAYHARTNAMLQEFYDMTDKGGNFPGDWNALMCILDNRVVSCMTRIEKVGLELEEQIEWVEYLAAVADVAGGDDMAAAKALVAARAEADNTHKPRTGIDDEAESEAEDE